MESSHILAHGNRGREYRSREGKQNGGEMNRRVGDEGKIQERLSKFLLPMLNIPVKQSPTLILKEFLWEIFMKYTKVPGGI